MVYYLSLKEMPLHFRNAAILVTEPFKVIAAVPTVGNYIETAGGMFVGDYAHDF